MISFIVAMDKNHVIGLNNRLPWRLPRDLRFFKEKTTHQTIIMGRKTFDSIGKPLPNRKNIVLSRSGGDFPPEIEVVSDINKILEWNQADPEKEYFVIGGAKIYEQMLPFADRMYITWIDHAFQGDTYFPQFSEAEWELTAKEREEKDEKNPYDFYFLQYDRKK
ncbi:dihydrofolate reductase [Virgibacillus proomii]|jgi:dihydrofolate reductase|uniref:dihydrofolate reductase n=1 Tax=Virgibacillus proomii TaxID=84407 RepID=UPI000986F465|nr:dihydrofolate reductase [Virgibacillus proomii]